MLVVFSTYAISACGSGLRPPETTAADPTKGASGIDAEEFVKPTKVRVGDKTVAVTVNAEPGDGSKDTIVAFAAQYIHFISTGTRKGNFKNADKYLNEQIPRKLYERPRRDDPAGNSIYFNKNAKLKALEIVAYEPLENGTQTSEFKMFVQAGKGGVTTVIRGTARKSYQPNSKWMILAVDNIGLVEGGS